MKKDERKKKRAGPIALFLLLAAGGIGALTSSGSAPVPAPTPTAIVRTVTAAPTRRTTAKPTQTPTVKPTARPTRTSTTRKKRTATPRVKQTATPRKVTATRAPAHGRPSQETVYVLNTSTKKIHKPSCRYASTIAEKNYREYSGSLSDLLANGYTTCSYCKPK